MDELHKRLVLFLKAGFLDHVPSEKFVDLDREVDWAITNVTEPALKLMCEVLGHDPQMDYCGLPDYCFRCEKHMPGQAPQRTKSGS